ncbi:MAG: DUF1064 domain-containing protein [Clostridiaceae bacterium]|nr:DUF1064 domain-containing protein [Clostridiaceae bacterium]
MGMSDKDISRLGPSAQRQIMQKVGGKKHQREAKTSSGNKYNAHPTKVVMSDGSVHTFPSAKEARRYKELELLQRAGKIFNLRWQVPFELIPTQVRENGKKEQPARYIADFVYIADGREVIEDTKGYTDTKSAAYKLYTVKRKLMLQRYGITIKEV